MTFVSDDVAASGPTAGWIDPPPMPDGFIVPVSPQPTQPPGAASAVKVVMDALVDLRTRIDALEQWAAEVQTALTFQAGQIDMLGKRPTGQPRPKPGGKTT